MTIERNRYFAGKLLDESDLTLEQDYFLDKARRHNRMLHGWGIVSGLGVLPGAAAVEVTVEPGYALDPNGNEIVVEDEVTVDLSSEDAEGGDPLYLAVRHAECMVRPVPTGDSSEYSRIRESFVLGVLTELPESYREPGISDMVDEPWVILAEVALDSARKVAEIDTESHRRSSA